MDEETAALSADDRNALCIFVRRERMVSNPAATLAALDLSRWFLKETN